MMADSLSHRAPEAHKDIVTFSLSSTMQAYVVWNRQNIE
jgi:hypothetical protein